MKPLTPTAVETSIRPAGPGLNLARVGFLTFLTALLVAPLVSPAETILPRTDFVLSIDGTPTVAAVEIPGPGQDGVLRIDRELDRPQVVLPEGPTLNWDRVRLHLSVKYDPSEGLIAPAVGNMDGVVFRALPAQGSANAEILRSSGVWDTVSYDRRTEIQPERWYHSEIEIIRQGRTRTWALRIWPDGAARPEAPEVVAVESCTGAPSPLRAGFWTEGQGGREARDLEVATLEARGSLLPGSDDEWPVTLGEQAIKFQSPNSAKNAISIDLARLRAVPKGAPPHQAPGKTATSFPCDAFFHHFDGYAPGAPDSWATLALPPIDNDCDGAFNEDPWNWRDDDDDGLVDEDTVWGDPFLNWTSHDDEIGDVATGDHGAVIIFYRRWWPVSEDYLGFATVSGDVWLVGAARIRPLSGGVATVGRGWSSVEYLLSPAINEPLELIVLESGVELENDQWFTRPVVLTAETSGGSGAITTLSTIDGGPYILGESFSAEGSHVLVVEATDSTETVSVEKTFGIDATPPSIEVLDPALGAVTGSVPVTLSGRVSADTVNVTVSGIAATLGAPSGEWRTFTSEPLILSEGLSTVELVVTDHVGWQTTIQHSIDLDTVAPTIAFDSPAEGAIFGTSPAAVGGIVSDAHLESVDVAGQPATISGGRFSSQTGLVEGSNFVQAVATDVLGRSTTAQITLILDTTAPDVDIDTPGSGAVLDAETVTVGGSVSDPYLAGVQVSSLDGVVVGDRYTVENVPLVEGPNQIAATAWDEVGNTYTSPSIVIVRDTLPPELSIDELPTLTSSATVTVEGDVSDPHLQSVIVNGLDAVVTSGRWVVDALTLAEGENPITAVAVDTLGHQIEVTAPMIVVDTLPPEITITMPTDGAGSDTSTVRIEGTVSDPHLDPATVTVHGQVVPVTAGTFALDLELPEGDAVITASAEDSLGHVGFSAPVTVTVDTLAPVITLTEPFDALVATPSVTLMGTVHDPHLESVTVNGVLAVVDGVTFVADGVELIEGENSIVATATDSFSHSSDSNTILLTLDTVPPELTVTSPTDQQVLGGGTVLVEGSATDLHPAYVTVNGLTTLPVDGLFSIEIQMPEGGGEIVVEAADAVDNTTMTTLGVIVDSLDPVVTIDQPAFGEGACSPGGVTTVSGRYSDANPPIGGAGLTLHVRSAEGVATTYASDVIAGSWNVAGIDLGSADGMAVLTVTAGDAAGHESRATKTIAVDTTTPSIQLVADGSPIPGSASGEAPAQGESAAWVTRVFGARAVASDGASPAPPAEMTLDGLPYAAGMPIDVEGEHLLIARATDCAGHVGAAHALFNLDLTAPSVITTLPTDGALLAEGPQGFSGTADADLAGAWVNGQPAVVGPGGVFDLSPIEWLEGANSVTVRLQDFAGNESVSELGFRVDTSAPTITILIAGFPVGPDAVFTTGVIPEIIIDDPEATVTMTLDGAAYVLGSPVESDGAHTLHIDAEDQLGRMTSAEVQFEIDLSDGPSLTITSPLDAAVLTENVVTVIGTVSSAETVTVNHLPAVITGETFTLADLALEDGVMNTIVAVASDQRGRKAMAVVNVFVRAEPGQILITEPIDAFVTPRAAIDVAGFVVGGADMTSDGMITVQGQIVQLGADGGFRLNDLVLTEGSNQITASITDSEGRPSSTVVTVISDQTPPELAISIAGESLAQGAVLVAPATVDVQASDGLSGLDSLELLLNGEFVAVIDGQATITIELEGGYSLVAEAIDRAGNRTRLEKLFVVGGGCSINGVEPADETVVAMEAVSIHGEVQRAAGVTIVTSGGVEYTASLSDQTFVVGDVPLTPGDNVFTLKCRTAADAESEWSLLLKRLTGDGPLVTINSPVDGALVELSGVVVEGVVTDPEAELFSDGAHPPVAPDGAGGATFAFERILTEGPNLITVTAVDDAGRSASDRVLVVRDTSPPSLIVTSPSDGAHVGLNGAGQAVLDVSGLVDLTTEAHFDRVTVTSSQGAVTAIVDEDTGVFVAEGVALNPATLGSQILTVQAFDSLGHATSVEFEIVYDPDGPGLELTQPADHLVLETGATTVTVEGNAWAHDGAEITVGGIALDPSVLAWSDLDASGRRSVHFQTSVDAPISDGALVVTVRVTDQDGRYSQARRTVIRDQTAPTLIEFIPSDGAIGVAASTQLMVLFSENVVPASLAAADGLSLNRVATGETVAGSIFSAGPAVAFVPAVRLSEGEIYIFRAGVDVIDLAGNPLASAVEAMITIGTGAGLEAPVLDVLPETVCASSLDVKGSATPGLTARARSGQLEFTSAVRQDGRFEITVPLSGEGYHVITVDTFGPLGESGPAVQFVVRRDCSGPEVIDAVLDGTTAQIVVTLSEEIDPTTATFGDSGAAVRLFDPSNGVEQSATLSSDGDRLILDLDGSPEAWWRSDGVRLVISAPLADLGGRQMTSTFDEILGGAVSLANEGLLGGQVFDDATGRPLANVTAELFPAGSVLPGCSFDSSAALVQDASDENGRYGFIGEIDAGRWAILLSKEGYLPVVRRLDLDPSVGRLVFDARLTPTADAAGLLDPVSGGLFVSPDDPLIELEIDPGAVPGEGPFDVVLTPRSGQGLPDLLPLGYTPVAILTLDLIDQGGTRLGADIPFAAAGVRLTLPLPNWADAAMPLIVVHYDVCSGVWRRLEAATVDGAGATSFALASAGTFGVVLPDEEATIAPPAVEDGQILLGATLPEVYPELEATLALDPPVVQPHQRATARIVGRSLDGTTLWPAGLAVQATIDEKLELANGGEQFKAPFTTDLILYHSVLAPEEQGTAIPGAAGALEIFVSPSLEAAEALFDVGWENIRLFPFTDVLIRGTVVGPMGGSVQSDDGIEVFLPEGAVSADTVIQAELLDAVALAALPPVEGYTILAAVSLDFEGAVLARPARLRLPLPEATPESVEARVILAMWHDFAEDGRGAYARLTARTERLPAGDGHQQRLGAVVEAAGSALPLEGITTGGLYVFLAAQQDLAFATGFVRDHRNLFLEASRVAVAGLGTADLTDLGGRYSVPFVASGAEITAKSPQREESVVATIPSAPPASIIELDLQITPTPPVVETLAPLDGAVDVVVGTRIEVLFSKILDPASVGPQTLTVELATADGVGTGAMVRGGTVLSADGRSLIFEHFLPLPAGWTFLAHFVGAVRDIEGTYYADGPFEWHFTTSTVTVPDGRVHPERFRIGLPDETGHVDFWAEDGAVPSVPSDSTPWAISPHIVYPGAADDPVTDTFPVNDLGGLAPVALGHPPEFPITTYVEIWVRVLDPAGAVAAHFRVGPFSSPDGRGFIAPADTESSFTTADDVTVHVPSGAFDRPTLVTVTPLDPEQTGVAEDLHLGIAGYYRLAFVGQAAESLVLEIPAPSDVPDGAKILVGKPTSLPWGRRLRLLTLGGIIEKDGERYLTNAASAQPPIPDLSGAKAGGGDDASLWMAFTAASDAAWFFQSGAELAFSTFTVSAYLGVNNEAFFNLYADAWVYMPPAEDWSGQVVLPTIPDSAFSVEGRDTATGWLLHAQDYGIPADPDANGFIILEGMLGPQPGPPRILGATPFDLVFFAPPDKGETQRLRLDLVAKTSDQGIVSIQAAAGHELSGGMSLGLVDPTDPLAMKTLATPAFVCSNGGVVAASETLNEDVTELMLQVGPGRLDPVTSGDFIFTFSSRITADLQVTSTGDLVTLKDLGPASGCQPDLDAPSVDLSLDVRNGGRILAVQPIGGLEAERHYELTLKTQALFPDRCAQNQGSQTVCAAPQIWRFTTASSAGDVVASGGGVPGQVRSIHRIGNLLFSATLEGALRATDLAGGPSADVGEHSIHSQMAQGAVRSIRTLATDGHGRLFFAGEYGGIWVTKAIAVEDVAGTPIGSEFSARPGSIRVAYAPGADLGSLSEMLAFSGLDQAIPVDFEIVVRDVEGDALELMAFCEANNCSDDDGLMGQPDAMGVYHLEAIAIQGVPIPGSDDPNPCGDAGMISVQRVTIDNLSTGQNFSVSVGPGDPASIEFSARPGDRLRIRHNVSTTGYLALMGSGVAVIDLNRAFDNEGQVQVTGFGQCGRGLGFFQGAGIDVGVCGGGLSDGIAMTPALAPLPSTVDPPQEPGQPPVTNGAGSMNLFSVLMHKGFIHTRSPEDIPGDLSGAERPIVCMRDPSSIWLRDIAVATGVTWYDQGLWSPGPGRQFVVKNALRFLVPEPVTGDLLFVSAGQEGIYVFDVTQRDPQLIGHLKTDDHTAFKLQVEEELGLIFAGGWGGLLDLWPLDAVNMAPPDEVEGVDPGVLAPPTPRSSFDNIPWPADQLGIDPATGLLYTWGGETEGAVAIPFQAPSIIAAGVFRAEADPGAEPDDPIPRELRPAATILPLGIPSRYAAPPENEEKRKEIKEEDQKKYTAAFKIRIALPGNLGPELPATVEALRVRPPGEMMAFEDLGPMRPPAPPAEWPAIETTVHLKRLADDAGTFEGRFGQTYNFYESEEILLAVADPRGIEDYTPQGTKADGSLPDIESEAGQCRNCEMPEYLRDDDTVVPIFAAGPYLRVRLKVEDDPVLETYFKDRWQVPAAVIRFAAWADDLPSPQQVSLAEPVLNPALWSPGEGGLGVSLVSGESMMSAVDHAVPGRGIDFAFARSYRSEMLTYNPLGTGGWTANLFAHLRENLVTREVEYHDGAGHVWRFYPADPAEGLELPNGAADGDYWALAGTYDLGIDAEHETPNPDRRAGDYYAPKGLYLQLKRQPGGFFHLIGIHNDCLVFDSLGRLVAINDRLRQNAGPDEVRGNRIRLHYDEFGRLNRIEDDYNRPYHLTYDEDVSSSTFGLLKELEDFADRKIQWDYEVGGTRLKSVTLPEVTSEALIAGEAGPPVITYSYDPTNFLDAPLHGIFAGRRFKGVKLPGRNAENDPERITVTYKIGSGRSGTVALAGVGNPWNLVWTDDPDTGLVTKVETTTPWGQKTEHHLFTEGADRGRVENRTAIGVEVLTDGFEPSGENLTPVVDQPNLTTQFTYADDGSGRITGFKQPDGGDITLGYREGSRLAGALPKTVTRQGSAGSLQTTVDYHGPDGLPTAVTDPAGRKTLTQPFAIVGGETSPTRRGFETEAVLTDTLYRPTGLPEKILVGASLAKAVGDNGLKEITLDYMENPKGGGEGYLESIVTGGGPETRFEYGHFGNPETITRSGDTTTNTTKQTFDAWDRPFDITIAFGSVEGVEQGISNRFDLSGRLITSERTQTGVGAVTVTNHYNDRDQLIRSDRAEVASTGGDTTTRTTYYEYDLETGLMKKIKPPAGENEAILIERDDSGRPVKITFPAPNGQIEPTVIHKAYDRMGRLVYTTDGDRGWWKATYDDLGRLITEKLADGTTIARGYDSAGDLDRVILTGSDGKTRIVEYDVSSFGAVTDVRELNLSVDDQPTERATHWKYDAAGRISALTTAGRTEQTITYNDDDKSGRIESVTDAFGNITTFIYSGKDPWPRTVTTDEAESNVTTTTTFTYDARGRVTHLSSADGYSEHRRYDESGNLLEVYNDGPYKKVRNYKYDGWGRLQKITVPGSNGRTTTFDYDKQGRITKSILARNIGTEETTFTYDHQGNLKTRTLPDAPTEEYFYYPNGTLEHQVTRRTNSSDLQLELAYTYDALNRPSTSRISNLDDFSAGGLPSGLEPIMTSGDQFTFDGLARTTRHARLVDGGGEDDTLHGPSLVDYAYALLDPRPLPTSETVGALESLWPDAAAITRNWDIFDRIESLSGPGMIHSFGYDDLDRRVGVNPDDPAFTAAYVWGGASRYFGHEAGAGSQVFGYTSVGLLNTLSSTYGTEAAYGNLADLGAFTYQWTPGARVKEGRLLRDEDQPALLADMGWGWGVDSVTRLRTANTGGREWTFDVGRADEMIAVTAPGGNTFSMTAGVNGRIESIVAYTDDGITSEALGYDSVGARISDGRHEYGWSWRSELERVTRSEYDQEVTYAYDAEGRLLSRTEKNSQGDFLTKRAYLWNGWEFLAQVGLNFSDEVLWRVDNLPGPVGLDDSPQLRVTTHIHDSDPEPEITRIFDLVRDEMGTVLAILEDEDLPEGETGVPGLKSRFFYDPYGQAHIEYGPELRTIKHDAELTTIGVVDQVTLDDGEPENPVIGIAGSLVITTSIEIDEASLSGGLILEQWDDEAGGYIAIAGAQLAVEPDETDPTTIHLMPVDGWREAQRYRLKLTPALTDRYGRAFVPVDEGEAAHYPIALPADVLDTTEDLPGMPVDVKVGYDSAEAAAATLDCRANPEDDSEPCFPGGVNFLFQGAWTDPTSGIAYHRNRWYDPRTANWLSEDPLGAVDSPNLYAFVGWGPHVGVDPLGLRITFAGETEKRAFKNVLEFALKNRDKHGVATFLAGLLALEKSEVEYRIGSVSSFETDDTGGVTRGILTDDKSELDRVDVLYKSKHGYSVRERVAHELQHAIQFEFGRLSFAEGIDKQGDTISGGGLLYDIWDEIDAFRIQGLFASNTSNRGFRQKIARISGVINGKKFSIKRFIGVAPEYKRKSPQDRSLLASDIYSLQIKQRVEQSGVGLWDVRQDKSNVQIWNSPTDEEFADYISDQIAILLASEDDLLTIIHDLNALVE